ncbi:MAG: hypothetical protein JO067_06525 [Cupriavidus sp.]|nr:hypothetical protein [Cupriavidus sp.]
MATKAEHVKAIMAQRMEWTQADKLQAEQLAMLRAKLDHERKKTDKAPLTVPTAAGGEKPNPVFAGIEKLAKQEAQLTRRLQLGATRTAGGQYKAAVSPMEKRQQLWERLAEHCVSNLIPGLWLHSVREAGCEIPEDSTGWPNNPQQLPMPDLGRSL